ncbi:hypothetical protein LTR62_006234 [Meristemomyces frigidus]|uniref:LsmAD domain-containing protein n=1 Tax=Meristemomyces frigidus TaxID=1508187 RepID=A0AAN7TDP4_9PEZI|nr:hypothetical protein LTR62_006234 [Meristemomyces frigidus]
MSTVTANGSDASRSSSTNSSAPKQSFKGGSNAAKALDGARKQNGSPVDGQNRKQQQSAQPKAWQGTNPITQRPSSSMTNGTEKPLPKLPQHAQQVHHGGKAEKSADKHAHDRLLFAVANCMGLEATLTLKNGEQYSGVFCGGSFESSRSKYTMKMVRQTRTQGDPHVNGNTDSQVEYVGEGEDHAMAFDVQDTMSLAVDGVDTSASSAQQNGTTSSFLTDTQISARGPAMPQERELQRWDASADTDMDLSLELSGNQAGWDQFAVNERMYGVQSTYDENIYTTAIDRSDPRYRQKEAEAQRIANEIEGSVTGNAHVAEERRVDAYQEDAGDEEEKYSGIQREPSMPLPKRSTGAYVPPSQRPITNTPTVSGAPFDPAIISVARPVALPQPPVSIQPPANEPSVSAERLKPADTKTSSRETSVPAVAQPVGGPTDQAEDHVRKTRDAFKEFANLEKLKARQAQEQKRAGARQEKNVKLNDLKKFAANFKLNSRVPDDLVPILAKDREKQQEIKRKAEEAAKEHEVTAEDRKKRLSASATPPTPASTTPQINAGPLFEQRAPYNQHSRARVSQQMRGGPNNMAGQTQSPRVHMGQGRSNQGYGRGGMSIQPPHIDSRVLSGPAIPSDPTPLSPTSANRLNINAIEFRPTASAFTPSGTTPSPQRKTSQATSVSAAEPAARFFGKDEKAKTSDDRKEMDAAFNPVSKMLISPDDALTEPAKKSIAANGGIPQPYRTAPTWPGEDGKSYKDEFYRQYAPSQGISPMHTPNSNAAHMPHAHQLPPHMQGPHMTPPNHRQQYYSHQQGPHIPAFDPRMQQFGPNGSVHNSPRFNQAQIALGGQMQHMQMQQYGGQPIPGQYGMSPSMQHRQMQGMQAGGSQQMMMGGAMSGQQFGQSKSSLRSRPGDYQQANSATVPGQSQRGYSSGGPQFANQHMAPMMAPNPSSGGSYMNTPMQQQHSGYSPMPPHAQPNMGHPNQHAGAQGGYNASPRPPMMTPHGSHQGYNMNMNQQMHSGGPGMQGHYGVGQGQQPHPMHLQQRQLSSGYGQQAMQTPRQGQSVPMMGHGSPGMGMGGSQGPGPKGEEMPKGG